MARLNAIAAGILILLSAQACRKADKAATPPTITLIDQIWPDAESRRRHNEEFRQFTRETGIRVELLLAPPEDSLTVSRQLLATQGSVADVYAVDVIWPSILAEQLIDLKPYIPAQEIAEQSPHLVANFTVNGRLVGLPYYFETGLLFYRTDLLQKYGYRAPPATWEELEKIAARIQAGERAQGNRNFWGFVWQGAPSEALTCNALEWQASEGGGSIIENGAVTVNNPATKRAWERAGRWVGSISPPGVVAYHESDTKGRWQSGGAAFMRNWSNTYLAAVAESSAVRGKFAVCPLPKGRAGIAGTVGGDAYAVSKQSLHPREAAMFIRFMCRRQEQLRRSQSLSEPVTIPELYTNGSVLQANPFFREVLRVYQRGLVFRPSAQTGKLYPDVSRAYFEAVHAVLTHEKTPEVAATELETALCRITGLKPRPAAETGNGSSGAHLWPQTR